jgi:hypothetical protein
MNNTNSNESTKSNESQSNVQPGQFAQTGAQDAQPHKDAKPSPTESGEKLNAEKSAPAKSDVAGSSRR